jgi:hypothetical protein
LDDCHDFAMSSGSFYLHLNQIDNCFFLPAFG